ncbi:MAG TPA: DUF1854 domain-containing protein [Candidatus Latescibacteria bacterium]|jgi:hypothetical protein|nr:DUF1854 domain-containing protein [Candidatus Latescibacterota bacterium]
MPYAERTDPAEGVVTEPLPTYDLMNELALLDPERVRFSADEYDELYLCIDAGEPQGPLTVQRAFPVSEADEFLSLKDADDAEVGVIRRLDQLDAASRTAIEEQLQWSYFACTITAIHSIEVKYHVPHWDVETDRGPRVFQYGSRRDIRVLPRGRVLIRDADGNGYEIPDVSRLDAASQAIVEVYI